MAAARPVRGSIVLVGCGRMGGALLAGWQPYAQVYVLDPAARGIASEQRLLDAGAISALPRPLTIVLAVKPQVLAGVMASLRPQTVDDVLYLSVVAGASLATLSAGLGQAARIVRAMPNTPAAVLQGISALVAGAHVDDAQRTVAESLMRAVGAVLWLEDEAQMDAVTAISGSGPAYFFRFAEALAEAGAALGLPQPMAMQLARATFIGAGALAAARGEDPLGALREEVTSPGGTTAAALAQFDAAAQLSTLVRAATEAARRRSIELGAQQQEEAHGRTL